MAEERPNAVEESMKAHSWSISPLDFQPTQIEQIWLRDAAHTDMLRSVDSERQLNNHGIYYVVGPEGQGWSKIIQNNLNERS